MTIRTSGSFKLSGGKLSLDPSFALPPSFSIGQSLRFNDNDSARLSRTFTSNGGDTWTWSLWVKRGNLGTNQYVLNRDDNNAGFEFTTTNIISANDDGAFVRDTTAVFRDPSAWYHIVMTGNGTATKIYVNNDLLTLSGALNITTHNKNVEYNIGMLGNVTRLFDGYMAEIIFVDGQELDPTNFGEFDTTNTNVWKPKEYVGTFGTNGFHLDFADSGDLGNDVSGNNNDWIATNFTASDQVSDSPTNNYCVINPLDNSALTLSDGNLDVDQAGSTWDGKTGTIAVDAADSDGWYFEYVVDGVGGAFRQAIGIANEDITPTNLNADPATVSALRTYTQNGNKTDGTTAAYGGSWSATDVIGIHLKAGVLTFYKNGVSQGTAFSGLTGNWRPVVYLFAAGSDGTLRFAENTWTQTEPAGAKALSTSNLPAPDVTQPQNFFNTTLYTGDASVRSITGVGFQPDLVWIKNRSTTDEFKLVDAVRTATKELSSDSANAEQTDANGLTSFDADGFSLGTGAAGYNDNTENFVSWNFKELAGFFDIVGFTGTGAAHTEVHGLGVVPQMMIPKNRDTANGWTVYHEGIVAGSETGFIQLEEPNAFVTASTIWNNTAPTSSVFTVGSDASANGNTNGIINYLFATKSGICHVGSYVGNGSADGPFVWTGGKPAFWMTKNSTASASWQMMDSARDINNVASNRLFADSSAAESSSASVDFLSNGFKIRSTNALVNSSGVTYIYVCMLDGAVGGGTAPVMTAR